MLYHGHCNCALRPDPFRSDPIQSNPIPCHPVVQSNRLATTITPRLGEAISATQSKAKAESRLGIHNAIGSQRSRQIVTHNGCFYQRNGFFWPAGLLDLGYWVFSFCFGWLSAIWGSRLWCHRFGRWTFLALELATYRHHFTNFGNEMQHQFCIFTRI